MKHEEHMEHAICVMFGNILIHNLDENGYGSRAKAGHPLITELGVGSPAPPVQSLGKTLKSKILPVFRLAPCVARCHRCA